MYSVGYQLWAVRKPGGLTRAGKNHFSCSASKWCRASCWPQTGTCMDGLGAGRHVHTHRSVPGGPAFLWLLYFPLETTIKSFFFFLTIISGVEKSHLSCFQPAHPPGRVGEVSLGCLGRSTPVVSHVSKHLLPSGLNGFLLLPGTAQWPHWGQNCSC